MVVDQVIDKVLEKEANKVDREVTAYVITDLFINQLASLAISFSNEIFFTVNVIRVPHIF